MDWLRSRHDLDDERVLIGVTAGMLWLVGAIGAILGQLAPGTPDVNAGWFWGIAGCVVVYGVASVTGVVDWTKWSVARHAWAAALLTPLLAHILFLTGGQDSWLQPLLLLPLLHGAYFFALRISILLSAEIVVIAASPALYEETLKPASTGRFITFAVVAAVVVVWVRLLKARLVAAEAEQREMATIDALTGLVNRRGFDDRLFAIVAAAGEKGGGRRSVDAGPGFALILFDLDRFKQVNDTHGHAAGDRLLRAVSAACASRVRPGDTLARVGGDEFAVLAPGAGEAGAERLASELGAAVRVAGAQAAVAWAVHPQDGTDGETLLRTADRRLYAAKGTPIRA